MEKFMLIFQNGDKEINQSADEMQQQMGKWFAWIGQLRTAGKYVEGEPLLPGGKVVSGINTHSDGPYSEGKEIIGGYFIVHAENMEEAMAMCNNFPDFSFGGKVHVRQVMKVDMP